MKSVGKTLEDEIVNRQKESLEQDNIKKTPSQRRKSRSGNSSPSYSDSSSNDSSHNSPKQAFVRSRSASPEGRPTFKDTFSSEARGDLAFVK